MDLEEEAKGSLACMLLKDLHLSLTTHQAGKISKSLKNMTRMGDVQHLLELGLLKLLQTHDILSLPEFEDIETALNALMGAVEKEYPDGVPDEVTASGEKLLTVVLAKTDRLAYPTPPKKKAKVKRTSPKKSPGRKERLHQGHIKNLVSVARKRFDELDRDGSGALETDELAGVVQWLFKTFHAHGKKLAEGKQEALKAKLLASVDENHDGKISFKEFENLFVRITERLKKIQ